MYSVPVNQLSTSMSMMVPCHNGLRTLLKSLFKIEILVMESSAMAEHILRDIGNRHEFVVVEQAVPAKPTASRHRSSNKTAGSGTTRKKKKSSRAKRQPGVRRAAYKYRCPCLKCVGKDVPISYKSARDHIKEARGRYRRAHKSKGLAEAYRNRLMEERRRMDDFEADLLKYIAAEEGVGQENQMHVNPVENHDVQCEQLRG
ncbi:hypothetical protein M9435_003381 [Picochlorum sp. BPE23]|nr:hypothetical protein M9435_003381 [Picochlorum sp. BPE23]